jgi:hypothetical protein
MSRQWMHIALVGTILTIGGPVLAVAQSSQTKSVTIRRATHIPGMGNSCRSTKLQRP